MADVEFSREELVKEMADNASKQAYFAFIDEATEIFPSFKNWMIEVKKGGIYPVLTVAGLIALKFKKRELSEVKVKDFIKLSAENAEQATLFWASLPKVLKKEVKWYKSDNRFYTVERDAIAYLSNFMTDEQLSIIAYAAFKKNEELRLKSEKQNEMIEEAKRLFA